MEDFIQKIETLYELGRYRQAVDLCKKYLYSQSEYTELLYIYAINSYLSLNEHKKAEVLAKEALAKFLNVDIFYALYARIYMQRKNYKKALVWIDKAINLDANGATNLYIKANILNDLARYKEAKELSLKILSIDPNDLEFLYLHSVILYNLDDKKYKDILHKILNIDPNYPDALHFLSESKKSIFGREGGFLKALKLNPFSKEYQSSYKTNKMDFWIFICSVMLVFIKAYFTHFLKIDVGVLDIVNMLLILSIIHLSLYGFEPYILAFLFSFVGETDFKTSSAVFVSIFLAYFIVFLAGFVKVSVDSSIKAFSDSIYFVKNSSKKDILDELKGNVFYIFVYFCFLFMLMDIPKEYVYIQVMCVLMLPFLLMYHDKGFAFLKIVRTFILLYVLKVISYLGFEFFDKMQIGFLNYAIILCLSFFGVLTIRTSR